MKENVKMILLFACFFPCTVKAQHASPVWWQRIALPRAAYGKRTESNQPAFPLLRPDFAWRLSGTVCKKEWKLEQKTGLPFRFRLGSVAYCDWLEGKPNARWRP
ncbi:MAG TPA: hypothetical protein PKK69_00100 [Ferruginibacter sp.]|nr:hypothetical protein [Ferruginibacter sp.]